MLNSTYPWALIWVDQHNNVHFHDRNWELELERLEHIRQYGEPAIAVSLQGWWSPDKGDLHRIHANLYYDEDSHFTWLNMFPPPNPIIPPTLTSLDPGSDEPKPDVPMMDDADREYELDNTPNSTTIDTPMDDSTLQRALFKDSNLSLKPGQ
ncbi:hypothetical protein ARMGADRAFT_1086541 [Armillaria gallica]|uniref:Uncharacterized protein n=1 Tax=Armillaria gallica TaxID=47427 RepID=A0A2H3D4N9_ARMGA|nr:hypothetical protein ARMGADRAFT_1086541 [Armillaria gallica]